jgi:hypothetical protein
MLDANRECFMDSRLPASEYPKAWKEYNRRWYAVWLGLVISVAWFIVMSHPQKRAFIPFGSDLAKNLHTKVIAIGPAVVILMAPYIWFFSWACPRCGFDFTDRRKKIPLRSDECCFCKLRRNAVSEFDDADNGNTWRELNSEEDNDEE